MYALIEALGLTPRYLITVTTGRWPGGDLDCDVFIIFHEFAYILLPLSIIVINIHTVLWIKDPSKYVTQMTTKVFISVMATPWLASTLIVTVTFACIAPAVGRVYQMNDNRYSLCAYDNRLNRMYWFTYKALCHFFVPLAVNLPILIALAILARNRLRSTSAMEDDSAISGRSLMVQTLAAVTALNVIYYLLVSPYYMFALCRITGLLDRSHNGKREIARATRTIYRFTGIILTMWWLVAFPETRSAVWEVLRNAWHVFARFCCVKVHQRKRKGVGMSTIA